MNSVTMHPSQFPGTHRPAEFSCIWVDGLGGEWVVESNSVSDDVGHFVDWIADCLVMGDRIACIVHLMF